MAYFPLFVELKGAPVLVVGGGRVALGKARQMRAFGAEVAVAAPEAAAGLRRLARERKVRWLRRAFRPGDLAGVRLAVAATDSQAVNRQVSRAARKRGIPVNVVDQPALCSFVFPAVVRRGRLVLAVSTGGAAPALAKRIREDLEKRYGPEWAGGLAGMARARRRVMREDLSPEGRKRLFERALKAYWKVIRT